jgi:hypothetical protein
MQTVSRKPEQAPAKPQPKKKSGFANKVKNYVKSAAEKQPFDTMTPKGALANNYMNKF